MSSALLGGKDIRDVYVLYRMQEEVTLVSASG